MGALLVLGPRVLPEYRDPTAGRLDLVSAGMSVLALLAVVYGVKLVAQDGPSAEAALAIVGGAVLGWAWVRRQRRLADPMIDIGLFRIRTFNVALLVNFVAIFVMVGYVLYIAQYLQLVLGMSPLEAGLWSVPGAAGFVVGSQLAPRLVSRIRPGTLVASGLAAAAAGLFLLTRVAVDHGLLELVVASVVISLGMGPVFGLTTEMVVGSAPDEKAGAASGISETAAELGGALGIAGLGSVGVAIYRSGVQDGLPPGVPAAAAAAARDTLGGAVSVATELPGPSADALLDVARHAFLAGLHLTSAIAAVVAAALAVLAAAALRRPVPASTTAADAPESTGPEGTGDAPVECVTCAG
jgi:DHA2 family multidrug resistance protein-like MFS transporter